MDILQYEERPPAVEAVVYSEKILAELMAWVSDSVGSIQKLDDGNWYLVNFMYKQVLSEGDIIVRFPSREFLRFGPDEFRAKYRFVPIGGPLGGRLGMF